VIGTQFKSNSKSKSLVHALLASSLLFSNGAQAALIPLIVTGINLAGIIPVIPPLDTALLSGLIYNNNIQISSLGQLSGSATGIQANSLARVIQIDPLNLNLANPGDALRISGPGHGVEFEAGGNNSTLSIGSGSNINILGSGSGVLVDSLVTGIGLDNAGKILSTTAPAISNKGNIASFNNELTGTISSTASNAFNIASGSSINDFNNQGVLSTTSNNSTINAVHSLGNILSTVTNSGSISASAGSGLALLSSAQAIPAIMNSGTISSGSIGSGIQFAVAITGNITNAVGGLIQSSEGTGLNLTGGTVGGSILNSGTLSSNGAGSGLSTSIPVTGDIVNNATGAITSVNGSALNLGNSASIVNLTNIGNIATTANNVLMNAVNSLGNITGAITNSGSISAASGSAVALLGSTLPVSSITNSGTMSSNGAGSGLQSAIAITGNITNDLGKFIQSQLGNALNLSAGSVGGDIVNNGTLSSNGTGSGMLSKAIVIGNIINNSTVSFSSKQGTALYVGGGRADWNTVKSG